MVKTAFRGNIVLPNGIFHQGTVLVEGDCISEILSREDPFPKGGVDVIDYGDAYIAPGFLDLHFHGAMGKDVMDCREESLKKMAEYQAANGVTGFLGSTMSSPLGTVLEVIRMIKDTEIKTFPSEILGVYIEGPFLSTQKKGAHRASFLKGITERDCEKLAEAAEGLISAISLAPEVENNQRFIPFLKESGFVVAIGHTDATYEQALESITKVVSLATHLFNAMS